MCAQKGAKLWYEVAHLEVRFVGLLYQNVYQVRTPDNTETLKEAFERGGYSIKQPRLPVVVIESTHFGYRAHYMVPLEFLY